MSETLSTCGGEFACITLQIIVSEPLAEGEVNVGRGCAGSWLYTVFEVQAWLSLAVGGLLSFNLLFPTDQPSIARMLGCALLFFFSPPCLALGCCTLLSMIDLSRGIPTTSFRVNSRHGLAVPWH